MSDSEHVKARVDDSMLASYLHSHLIAASAGERLFEQAAKVWRDSPHGSTLSRLAAEVGEDKAELEAITQRLDVALPAYKRNAAWLGAQLSKIDPLNPLRSPRGHTGQLELEALVSAVTGKSLLWETLLLLSQGDVRIDALQMEKLHDRALKQIREIADIMRDTAAARFHAGGR